MAQERTPHEPTGSRPVVLIPIKDFRQAKNRLAQRLDSHQRQELARSMAEQVIRAAAGLDVRVVCSDAQVAQWARSMGVAVEWVEADGLNPAITAAVAQLDPEAKSIMICHADLPRARTLSGLVTPGRVTIVPDRHLDGTNVLVVPAGTAFRFQYGAGSLHAHIGEALRLGLDVEIRQIPDLQWDVDTPADLDEDPEPQSARPDEDPLQ